MRSRPLRIFEIFGERYGHFVNAAAVDAAGGHHAYAELFCSSILGDKVNTNQFDLFAVHGGFRVLYLEAIMSLDYNDRKYIPGVGIYFSNTATGKYRFLMPQPYAVDCCLGDALVCDSSGRPKPGMECPVPRQASDFGARFADVECFC